MRAGTSRARAAAVLAVALALAGAACSAGQLRGGAATTSAGDAAAPADRGAGADAQADGAGRGDGGALADADAASAGDSSVDSAPACPPLAQRVTVAAVSVAPATVYLGSSFGFSSGRRVILSLQPNGKAKIAWHRRTPAAVHLTPLDARLARAAADIIVPGEEAHGLVAHDDGAALLLREGDKMLLRRLDGAGQLRWERTLVGGQDHAQSGAQWVDSWPHEGRLRFDGQRYAAYFGNTRNFGGATIERHQGDTMRLTNADGSPVPGGWLWGCSHRLDVRLAPAVSPGASTFYRFGAVCLSDCFPRKAVLYLKSFTVHDEPSGNCGGRSDAKLGGLVADSNGYFLTFASEGQPARPARDIALAQIPTDGRKIAPPVWLTNTPQVDETAPHLARYGKHLLAGWRSDAKTFHLAVVDKSGVIDGPAAISAELGERDDFVVLPGGDVAWAHAWGDMSKLRVVRVRLCGASR